MYSKSTEIEHMFLLFHLALFTLQVRGYATGVLLHLAMPKNVTKEHRTSSAKSSNAYAKNIHMSRNRNQIF